MIGIVIAIAIAIGITAMVLPEYYMRYPMGKFGKKKKNGTRNRHTSSRSTHTNRNCVSFRGSDACMRHIRFFSDTSITLYYRRRGISNRGWWW